MFRFNTRYTLGYTDHLLASSALSALAWCAGVDKRQRGGPTP